MKLNALTTTSNEPPAFILCEYKPQNVAKTLIQKKNQLQSFYIFDMDEAYRRIQHFKQMMPRVKIFYATKSNDTPMMLKLAISENLGFDCASPAEIHKLRLLNVSPRNMIYTTPIKAAEHMKYARATGLTHTVFESSTELRNLKNNWSDARLLLRITINSERKGIELKFGCDCNIGAVQLLEEAAALGLKVVGISFQGDGSGDSFLKGLKYAKALFEHEASAGREMKIVDIGGEFASDSIDSIDEISKLVNSALETLFAEPSIQIIADPCQYFCASAFTLYCSISNVVRSVDRNDNIVSMIYMTDGVYGTLRYFEDSNKITKLQLENEYPEPCDFEDTILWGPSCDSLDRVAQNTEIRLPRCVPQDWLVLNALGTDTMSYSTKFSSITIPLIQPVLSVDLWKHLITSKVFTEGEFTLQSEVAPLPSTLPAILPISSICPHPKIPTLSV